MRTTVETMLLARMFAKYCPGVDPAQAEYEQVRTVFQALEADSVTFGFTGVEALRCGRCSRTAGDRLWAGNGYATRVCVHCNYVEIRLMPVRSKDAVS